MTAVLKLGGSLLTEKDTPETVDEAALADAVAAIADAVDARGDARGVASDDVGSDGERPTGDDRLVLVHGGGSFGHHHAAAWGVSTTAGTHEAEAVRDVHRAMTELDDRVVDALLDQGVPAVPVRPLSVGARDAEGDLSLPLDATRTLLTEGFVPVLHGDGVAHAGEGVTVVSGDELVVRLARELDADRVGACSTVPGVLDDAGDVIDRIDDFDAVADLLGGSDATDVSGGMAGKVRALLDLPASAYVFGPEGLRAFLEGGDPGTRIG